MFKLVYIKHPLKQLRNNLLFQTGRDTMTSQHQTTASYNIRWLFIALDSWFLKISKHEDCMTSLANQLYHFLVKKFLLYPNWALLVSFYAHCLLSSCHIPLWRVWFYPVIYVSADIQRFLLGPLKAFLFSRLPSASPHSLNKPAPWPSLLNLLSLFCKIPIRNWGGKQDT